MSVRGRESQSIVSRAEEQGWRVVRIGTGWKLFSPDGVTIVVIHRSPSDHRWKQNTLRDLRAGGFRP